MKRLLIGKIMGIVGICLLAVGVSYFLAYALEKSLYNDINLLVTFEDTKEFSVESLDKKSEEEALKTYPYIFVIENKENSNVNYIIYLGEKEVKRGLLSEVKDNLLYEGNIKSKSKDTYKIYVYANETLKDATYKYSILINAK